MFRISRGPAPEFLVDRRMDFLGMLWEKSAERDGERSGYIRFDPLEDILRAPEILEALERDFDGRCAFCRTRVDPHEVGHFRPRANTINFHGDHFPRHYFWLALDWRNLVLACAPCSQSRGNRFPLLDESTRASVPESPDFDPGAMDAALDAETHYLVDPTREDPAEHLLVDPSSGEMLPKTERGEVTIELFNLNRPELVEARREAGTPSVPKPAPQTRSAPEEAPRTRSAGTRSPEPGEKGGLDISFSLSAEGDEAPEEMGKKRSFRFTLDTDDYYRQSRKIEKIVLRNFRSIEDLTLPMAAGDADRAGWTVILGENGTGKSTLLQGMALALAGEEYREQLLTDRGLDAAAYVRRTTEGEENGAQPERGSVEVFLSGVPEPVVLEVERGRPTFSGTPDAPVLLLGYGSTRLLPRGHDDEPVTGTRLARADNLFDPFVPLGDARRWLLGLDASEFAPLAASFAELLDLGSDVELFQNHDAGRIDVRIFDTTVPLEELSDGYQSVIALCADIMSVLRERWGSMAVAEGVVLLDELGAHLHPKWRMSIVQSLRATFPRVQFIVTTHDPLCLRGLRAGEVIVMRRDRERRVRARTDLPPTEGLRVDQLLTSEHFGLSSTLEPEVERDFDRYYELLAEPDLDADEKKNLEELEKRFDQRRLLGETRRERLMLAAIDRHLAKESGLTSDDERREGEERLEKVLEETLSALEV